MSKKDSCSDEMKMVKIWRISNKIHYTRMRLKVLMTEEYVWSWPTFSSCLITSTISTTKAVVKSYKIERDISISALFEKWSFCFNWSLTNGHSPSHKSNLLLTPMSKRVIGYFLGVFTSAPSQKHKNMGIQRQ